MTQPKLREGANREWEKRAEQWAKEFGGTDEEIDAYCEGAAWALHNLPKLLAVTSWKGSFVDTPHSGLIFDKREKLEALAELIRGLEEKPSDIRPVAIVEVEDE